MVTRYAQPTISSSQTVLEKITASKWAVSDTNSIRRDLMAVSQRYNHMLFSLACDTVVIQISAMPSSAMGWLSLASLIMFDDAVLFQNGALKACLSRIRPQFTSLWPAFRRYQAGTVIRLDAVADACAFRIKHSAHIQCVIGKPKVSAANNQRAMLRRGMTGDYLHVPGRQSRCVTACRPGLIL